MFMVNIEAIGAIHLGETKTVLGIPIVDIGIIDRCKVECRAECQNGLKEFGSESI